MSGFNRVKYYEHREMFTRTKLSKILYHTKRVVLQVEGEETVNKQARFGVFRPCTMGYARA